jgi:hypothetical protein
MLTSTSDSESLARQTSTGKHEGKLCHHRLGTYTSLIVVLALQFSLHINNVTEAAQFLLWYLENVRKEGGKEALPWLSDCKLLLYEHPEFYAVVKDAQSTQDFTKLDQSGAFREPCVRSWTQCNIQIFCTGAGSDGLRSLKKSMTFSRGSA